MPDIAKSHCWPVAYSFIAKGETDNAVLICESEPCSMTLECQRFLGWIYYEKNDLEAALIWFGKAVDQGDAEAAFGLGSVHLVRGDFVSALECFQQAADSGYGRACHWIGYFYSNGIGVPRDDETAFNWYKRGTAYGYIIAERALLNLVWLKGGFIARVRTLPQFIRLIVKASVIAVRDLNDQRLIDVPNVFESKSRRPG